MIIELKSLRLDENLFKQIIKRYRDNQVKYLYDRVKENV